jgi:adenylate cyclase class 2
MAFEIELKARLGDYVPVKERLSDLGDYCRSYTKSDAYWLQSNHRLPVTDRQFPPSGVRVRRESSLDAEGAAEAAAAEIVLVTYKTKEISGGIEVNDEREFTVSNGAVFEELLERLGLHPDIRKEKQGWAWNIPSQADGQSPILAELSQVAGLGWFLELEIIADNNDEQTVEESRKRLLALLEKLEIPAEQIESKPYTMMLSAIKTADNTPMMMEEVVFYGNEYMRPVKGRR